MGARGDGAEQRLDKKHIGRGNSHPCTAELPRPDFPPSLQSQLPSTFTAA
jgi:hypothetical protein